MAKMAKNCQKLVMTKLLTPNPPPPFFCCIKDKKSIQYSTVQHSVQTPGPGTPSQPQHGPVSHELPTALAGHVMLSRTVIASACMIFRPNMEPFKSICIILSYVVYRFSLSKVSDY